jgi:hypothetical protein
MNKPRLAPKAGANLGHRAEAVPFQSAESRARPLAPHGWATSFRLVFEVLRVFSFDVGHLLLNYPVPVNAFICRVICPEKIGGGGILTQYYDDVAVCGKFVDVEFLEVFEGAIVAQEFVEAFQRGVNELELELV